MSVGLHSQSVNVSRLQLLSALRSNLEKHKRDYAEAVVNYRIALQVDLTAALVQANDPKSRLDKINVDFDHPKSYANQYQQVIDMLEYSVDETINLDSQAFRAYVKDEWSWKSSFELANSTFSVKAMSGNVSLSSADLPVGSARP
jgi:hypothetical protein